MINTRFELYKVKRELKRSGVDYTVLRDSKNEYGEPSGAPEIVGVIRGIYHEENSNIQFIEGETTITRTQKLPMILCEYEAWELLETMPCDYVIVNEKRFTIVGCVNIQEWSIVGDVSLEVFDGGGSNG